MVDRYLLGGTAPPAPVGDIVYVANFAAVGDGITDDTDAIQNALTAGAGKVVVFGGGKTYKCDPSSLSVPANTYLAAWGATFDFSDSHGYGFSFVNGGGISGGTLGGGGNASYNDDGKAIKCEGTNNSPAAPTYVNAPRIFRVTIREWGAYGVYLAYTDGGSAQECTFSGIGYAAVGAISANDFAADYNIIDDVSPGTSGDAYGIFYSRGNGTETADPRSYRCKGHFNTIKNVVASGGNNGHALDTHGGVDISFIGNNITGCEGGIFLTSSTVAGVATLAPLRPIAHSNTIDASLRVNYAILVSGAYSGSTVNEYADGCVVGPNTILGGGVSGASTTGAIYVQGTKNLRVDAGDIRNPSPHGVNLGPDNIGFNLSGGAITDPFDNSVTVPSCVIVTGSNNSGLIGGLTYRYESAGLGTHVAVNAIRINGSLTGLDIAYGPCQFVGIDSTHLAYSENTSTGVNSANLFTQRGQFTITLSSGVADGITDVTFAKRFPVAPKVTLQLRRPFNQGTKFPILGVDTAVAISATGFRAYALPYDATTWGSTGDITVDYVATT